MNPQVGETCIVKDGIHAGEVCIVAGPKHGAVLVSVVNGNTWWSDDVYPVIFTGKSVGLNAVRMPWLYEGYLLERFAA